MFSELALLWWGGRLPVACRRVCSIARLRRWLSVGIGSGDCSLRRWRCGLAGIFGAGEGDVDLFLCKVFGLEESNALLQGRARY